MAASAGADGALGVALVWIPGGQSSGGRHIFSDPATDGMGTLGSCIWMAARPAIDPRIQDLPSTTIFGNRLTRRQIADVQEMVQACSGLSRTELALTVCEHLRWHVGSGASRERMATRFLEQLAEHDIVSLPAKQPRPPGPPTADRSRSGHPPAAAAGRRHGQARICGVAGTGPALPSAGLSQAAGLLCRLLPARLPRAPSRRPAVRPRGAPAALPGRVDRLAGRALPRPSASGGAPGSVSCAAVDCCMLPTSLRR